MVEVDVEDVEWYGDFFWEVVCGGDFEMVVKWLDCGL